MATQCILILSLLVLVNIVNGQNFLLLPSSEPTCTPQPVIVNTSCDNTPVSNCSCTTTTQLKRSSFPDGFVFGAGGSAYQYEGGAYIDGKGDSIWDNFTAAHPDKIMDCSNGTVAVDSYHRYKEDVAILKEMGLDAYRFSIAWTRILPNGNRSEPINWIGVQYYNNLIDELLLNVLFHWDLPQALQDKYYGFLHHDIVNDFRDYADLCFQLFGDRVKHWTTLNEPWTYSNYGYMEGSFAPGCCSPWMDQNCSTGDSGQEPYNVTHNLLLAHSAAVKLYRERYQAEQNGTIGITLVTKWFVPYYPLREDQAAANRQLDFTFGWYMDPLTRGQYPESMQCIVGDRLPKFTEEESRDLIGSFDFIGVNYYTGRYAYDDSKTVYANYSYESDPKANFTAVRADGQCIGPLDGSSWVYVYPVGLLDLLRHMKTKYNNPRLYITENGIDEVHDNTIPIWEALSDTKRVKYHIEHFCCLQQAIHEGVNVSGYFAWSLLDNFEWTAGYTSHFGFNFVDFKRNLTRYPKVSAGWFKWFLEKENQISQQSISYE
ncbi:hypothetical protein F0562_001413 [Nyssa sinensis]|uniref:Beta-glucosidase n=1 Tax=Nyssa sinensis TaxID=561372 RepID=A0A5J5C307_9ASTE|nr:hypothetical protein F0562_001413 [Nyssa sinensis]